MRFKIIFLFVILAGLSGAVFFYQNEIFDIYYRISYELRNPDKISVEELMDSLERQVSAPPPLRISTGGPLSSLTGAGVLQWTNEQRAGFGLPLFKEDPELNIAAAIKAQDILERQYFAHDSPTGEGPAELADKAGYEFIAIGENLALGDFESDQDLVNAWMNSQGHRENILNPVYTEIGIAVIRGVFKGEDVWVAVQEFGKPLSACPSVDQSLKIKIEDYDQQLGLLEKTLAAKEKELNSIRPRRSPAYQQAVQEYNNLAEQYNELVIETKKLITLYNLQVQDFNECLAQ